MDGSESQAHTRNGQDEKRYWAAIRNSYEQKANLVEEQPEPDTQDQRGIPSDPLSTREGQRNDRWENEAETIVGSGEGEVLGERSWGRLDYSEPPEPPPPKPEQPEQLK